MTPFKDLSPTVTTLYAQLLQLVQADEASRSIADLKGTFVCKKIKQKNYWYLQHRFSGKQTQTYLGPESLELLNLIHNHQIGKTLKLSDQENRKRLCSMLIQGGVMIPDSLSSRVIMLLAESGVFKMGSVLVGTHAFQAYSQLLGVVWLQQNRTQDIDIAQERHISVALAMENASSDLPKVLDHARLGFVPVPPLNLKHPSTTFKILGRELHLDLLTPLVGKPTAKPIELPSLKVAAQPLRFLDYLISDPIECVIPYDDGILVYVPNPAYFVFHKLLVSTKREIAVVAKAKKDLSQALSLLEVLARDRKGDLSRAWEELKSRGKNWYQPVLKVLATVKGENAIVQEILKEIVQ
ncbi:MAG: hypothetical protein HYU97_08525 [Deltaproteobacteria bacterium]|nr:hypothetical protein [Deltaproteobacteria bacterium]